MGKSLSYEALLPGIDCEINFRLVFSFYLKQYSEQSPSNKKGRFLKDLR